MDRSRLKWLAILAVVELVIFGSGAALIIGGDKTAGILLIVIGAVVTSVVAGFIVLKGRQQARDGDEAGG